MKSEREDSQENTPNLRTFEEVADEYAGYSYGLITRKDRDLEALVENLYTEAVEMTANDLISLNGINSRELLAKRAKLLVGSKFGIGANFNFDFGADVAGKIAEIAAKQAEELDSTKN